MIQRGNLIGIISIIDILELACCFALIFFGAAGILNDDVSVTPMGERVIECLRHLLTLPPIDLGHKGC
jgi:hypothetical protein